MPLNHILVVGAGFAGAVYSRVLAENGFEVHVIDQRNHIAGNACDFIDDSGVRVHRYGPHLFHTNNAKVIEWLQRFGAWTPYSHRVRALLDDGRFVPLPINLTTINTVFDINLKDEADTLAFLGSIAETVPNTRNAAEYLYSKIGRKLTDLFFRPYTKKMWTLDLEDVDESVVRRIPLRFDDDDRYFNDQYQLLPSSGYTALFEGIFDHPNIRISLETEYVHGMEDTYLHCFNSMPIDVFFEQSLGELPYRSIRFHHEKTGVTDHRSWSVTNFVDSGKFTRETWWACMPGHVQKETGVRIITREEPCDYRDNNFERYYPVKTADGRYQKIYSQYHELSSDLAKMSFIGRCGTYQYLDMDQVVNQSLAGVTKWLGRRDGSVPTNGLDG